MRRQNFVERVCGEAPFQEVRDWASAHRSEGPTGSWLTKKNQKTMSTNRVRVDLPGGAEDRINLAKAIAGKHAELGTASPLGQLKWDKITPAIAAAETAHRESKRLQAQAEAATQTRDAALDTIVTFLRASRDVLSGVHVDEMRKLGDYGFTVTAVVSRGSKDTPEPAAKPTG